MQSIGPDDQTKEMEEVFEKLCLLEKECNAILPESCRAKMIGESYSDIWIWNNTHEYTGSFLEEACRQEAKGNKFAYLFYYCSNNGGGMDDIVIFFASSQSHLLDRFASIAQNMSAKCFLLSLKDKRTDFSCFIK